MLPLLAVTVRALDNGLGLKPQMGWNSWNKFACDISEKLIKQTADRIVQLGLKDKGYNYVNIDDCWQVSRDSKNKIVPGPNFPNGIKSLVDYVHSKGLLFGIYSDSGSKTCAGRPGSLGFQDIDAATYAEWGVDYLKYDNCNNDGTHTVQRYQKMRDALNKTGRPIFYSICDWGVDNPWEWGNATGNSWRTTYDISDNYGSFTSILDLQTGLEKFAGPGSWNDPDMLEVGNGGMTTAEYQAHFSLWALLKAPLILGCDLDKVTPATMAIIGNEEVIALSQDPLGKQGRLVRNGQGSGGIVQLYAMTLSDGSKGVVIFNRGSRPANFELNVVADLSLPGSKGVRVRDLVKHADIGLYHQDTIIFTGIESHGCLTLKFTSVDNEASI